MSNTDFTKEQIKELSDLLSDVLCDKLLELIPQQENLMDQAFGRILVRHKGVVSTITRDEIIGAYERITEYSFPKEILEMKIESKS